MSIKEVMKTDWNFFLFVLLATSALVSGQKSYKGHKVVTLRIENELQLQELQNLELQAGVRKVFEKIKKIFQIILLQSSHFWIHRCKLT